MSLNGFVIAVSGLVVGAVAATGFHEQPSADDPMAHMSAADRIAPHIVPTASQGVPGLPPSANSAPARLAASNRHSEWVKIPWEPGSKDSLMAWVVYPSTTTVKTPVVVVVHEIYGLQTWVRGVADQVAGDGFIAIAPDLNSKVRGGPSTSELPRDSANKLISGVPSADRIKGVTAAAIYAMSLPSAAPRYAVIGFCWGGQTVWMNAINGGAPGFSGGVAFYGPQPYGAGGAPNADSLAKITKAVMLLSGTKDPRIGAAMPVVDSIMKANHKDYFGRNYEGAVHGFVRAQNDPKTPRDEAEETANMAALKDGWPRTVEFLRKNLGMK
jgi:carboxymethylenebutenolidase